MQKWIFGVAIAGAIACLVVYVAMSVTPIILAFRKAREEAKEADKASAADGTADVAYIPGLIEAIGKLVEALAKAGPVLWALIGSMLFLLIAAFAAGLFPKVM